MNIGVATVQAPFFRGGAENLTCGLVRAAQAAGHEVEVLSTPFRFFPAHEVKRSIDIWTSEDLLEPNGIRLDRVICLKFPTYYLDHPAKAVWLLHQHRAAYDLWGTTYGGDLPATAEGRELKAEIHSRDTRALGACRELFTISGTVSRRLHSFNQVESVPLYHPPLLAERIYTAPAEPYIFCPSRLEDLKRQRLLIEAMAQTSSGAVAIIAGEGGQRPQLQRRIDDLKLQDRVRMIGRTSDEELLAWYARCLGVFFGPYDEDYGYVTLEAMLAAKPVITCTDSGGPLEFVAHGETGLVVQPDPASIADAIDRLYWDRKAAAKMGCRGLERYQSLNISWVNVVPRLLEGRSAN